MGSKKVPIGTGGFVNTDFIGFWEKKIKTSLHRLLLGLYFV